jgi:mercuric ion transport protein
MHPRRLLQIGTLGFVGTGLCCVTPVLVIALTALGLAGAVSYLDRVLWPLMAAFAGLMALALLRLWLLRRARIAPAQEANP